jgi:predicted RNase H-like HicB family nuclease
MSEEKNDLFEGLGSFLVNQDAVSVDSLEKETSKKPEEEVEEDKDKPADNGAISLDELEKELSETNIEDEDDSSNLEEDASNPEKPKGDSNIYRTLSELLKEEGIVEDTFEDKEALFNYFKSVADNNVKEWVDSLPKEISDLITNYEEGVPFDELLQIKSDQIRLNSITDESLEDNIDLQKNLVRNFYKEKGFTEAKIEKMVSKAEDLDELEDEAKEALAELKESENKRLESIQVETKRKALENQKAYVESVNKLNSTINEVKEIIPGVKIDEKTKKELFNMITKPAETRDGVSYSEIMLLREKNPLDFELKLNYYAKMGLFDENPKFDVIMKKSETKVLNKLERQLEEDLKNRINKSNSSSRSSEENTDIFDALKTVYKK